MKDFIWDWRYIIALIIMLVIFAIFEWDKFKLAIVSAMLMAKKLAKDYVLNSGQEQENWVVLKIYPCLPAPVKVFMSEAAFRKIIRWLYGKAKDYLDDGELNGSAETPIVPKEDDQK